MELGKRFRDPVERRVPDSIPRNSEMHSYECQIILTNYEIESCLPGRRCELLFPWDSHPWI